MEFRILGPLEVLDEGRPLAVGSGRQRALLALLVLHQNRVVSTERIRDELWGGERPDSAANAVQVYVAALRRAIEPGRVRGAADERLVTRDPGYMLRVTDEELDLPRFDRIVENGRQVLADDPARASSLIREALGMWRGKALEDVADTPFVRAQSDVLEERRLGAIESMVAADLALGRQSELVPELAKLTAEHPYREGLRAQLMLALYRVGRQAEALQVYRDTRHLLSDELGIDPGAELQALERAILRQDPELAAPELRVPAPARRTPEDHEVPAAATAVSALSKQGRRLTPLIVAAVATIAVGVVSAVLWFTVVRPALHSDVASISSVAGSGVRGFSTDGASALTSSLLAPPGVAVDRNVVYFVDGDRIRRVGSGGIVSTVAGTGTAGFGGDGGSAQLAELDLSGGLHFSPVGIAFDSVGNLYIPDAANHRVRKVTPEGTIATIAGTGTPGFAGDGGPAVEAQLNTPRAVAVDRFGNIFICDTENNRVRKIDTNGIITTVAGTGAAGFSGDNGAAVAAQLDNPQAVAVGADGNLYIADTNNQRIRKVIALDQITTVAGNGELGYSGDGGSATAARLSLPVGIAVGADGLLYIADTQNDRIRLVDLRGVISTFAGNSTPGFSGDGGAPTTAELDHPIGVAVDDSGVVFIADSGNNRIRRVAVGAR